MTEREAFEAWAKQPPMEWGCDRFPDNGAWPGSYRYYPAQCAWEGWQAARAQPAQAGQAEAVPSDVARDAERLDWLLMQVSGKEFKRIGVEYSGNCQRSDVDAAIAQQKGASHE